jgi:putative sterol carrier protein
VGELVLRRFRQGDEAELVKLFNAEYAGYGGFVPRTEEYWRWCCLKRPDVDENGIFLVTEGENGPLVGYAVVGSSGSIWEFCAGGDRKHVASILLREAVKYLDELGVSSVNVNVPHDKVLNEAFAEVGFTEVPAERMFVSTLSLRELFSVLTADAKFAEQLDEEMFIELDGAPFGVDKTVSVNIHDGKVAVKDDSSESPSVSVRMDFKTLLSVLFAGLNPYHAFFSGKVRVKPFWKTGRFLEFLSSVRVNSSWFFPLSDFG